MQHAVTDQTGQGAGLFADHSQTGQEGGPCKQQVATEQTGQVGELCTGHVSLDRRGDYASNILSQSLLGRGVDDMQPMSSLGSSRW